MTSMQEDVALKFIGYFRDSWPDNLDDPLKLVEDDCYYQSIVPTTDPIRGKAAIKAKWEKIKAEYGDQRHEMKGVGSGGGFVFTERVDYTKPGDTWIPIPLVAVFEVNERGKIFAWREYLDGGNVARKIGIEVSQLEESLKSHS
ncbi:MAG TPA: limonene-1,2-epoxide hydrolase family protein [Rhizorhapis sp.]